MSKYGIAVDINKCVGCYNCFLTCRDEFAGNDYPGYSAAQPLSGGNWLKVREIERGSFPKVKAEYIPQTCNHCEDAACIRLDQTGAVYRRPDGIVMIDPEKAKGNREIANTCPYRRIEWNEELELAQKCTMCAHLLDKGEKEPRCVESCPSGALVFGDLDDPGSEISKLYATGSFKPLSELYNMKEKVLYKDLPKKFIAGTVILGDIDEVAVGAEITITGSERTVATVTNGFGDFEVEGLEDNTCYTVRIAASGYKAVEIATRTSKDQYLGEIVLAK